MTTTRHTPFLLLLCVAVSLALAAPGFASGPDSGRIIPVGKVAFYKDTKKIGEYTAETLLPFDTVVVCQGRSAIRLQGLSFAAEDGTTFKVSREEGAQGIELQKGSILFSLVPTSKSLVLMSPHGTVSTQGVLFTAASDTKALKAYMTVAKAGTEVGVVEGGSLVLQTPEGLKTLAAGEKILLAQLPPSQKKEDDDKKKGAAAVGAAGAAGAAAGAGAGGAAAGLGAGLLGAGISAAGIAAVAAGGGSTDPGKTPSSVFRP